MQKITNQFKDYLRQPRVRYWLITLIVLFFVCLFFVVVPLCFSKYYAEFNNKPKNIGGTIDFEGYDIRDEGDCNLYGDWDFYYNHWMVTDNETAEKDAVLDIPTYWNDVKINGEKIGRSGYATYRLHLKNVPKGAKIDMILYNYEVSYRFFANGKLISSYGKMSKDINKGRVDGILISDSYVCETTQDVVIDLEISANSLGGLTDSPNISLNPKMTKIAKWIEGLPHVVLGVLIAYVLLSLVISLAVYRKRNGVSMFLLLLSLVIYFLTTKDIFYLITFYYPSSPIFIHYANIIAGFSANILMMVFFKHINVLIFKLKTSIILVVSFLAVTIAQLALLGTSYEFIPHILLFIPSFYLLYLLVNACQNKVRFALLDIIIYTFFIGIQIFVGLDFLSITVFGTETYPSLGLVGIMTLINVIYLVIMRESADNAVEALKLEQEIRAVKQESLREQVKPHFVFNSLTTIQSFYHNSLKEGDAALTRFSYHLRLNIDAGANDLIPFEDELKNISNYFDLENMRLEGKLTLLFDVMETGFRVPILSLQPLIENAIKYAQTDKKEDGYIQIHSELTSEGIIVSIIDNGIGFNMKDIRANAQGLKNITERLKYALNAKVKVDSKVQLGTIVTITIPEVKK